MKLSAHDNFSQIDTICTLNATPLATLQKWNKNIAKNIT
jgi:hypothetical protein